MARINNLKIKGQLVENNLTQQDLADKLECTRQTINAIVNGKANLSAIDLYKIAKLTNKPMEYFIEE